MVPSLQHCLKNVHSIYKVAKISGTLSLGWKGAYRSVSTRKSNSEMQRPAGKWANRPWQEGLFCHFVLVFFHFITFEKIPGDLETLDSEEPTALASLALSGRVVHMLHASWCTDATLCLSSDTHPLLSSSSARTPYHHLGQTREHFLCTLSQRMLSISYWWNGFNFS